MVGSKSRLRQEPLLRSVEGFALDALSKNGMITSQADSARIRTMSAA